MSYQLELFKARFSLRFYEEIIHGDSTPPSVRLHRHIDLKSMVAVSRNAGQRHICRGLWGRRFRHSITDIHTRWARASCPSPALPETAKMIVPLPFYTPFLTFKASARSTPHPDDWLFQPWMVSELILQSVIRVLVAESCCIW